MPDLTSSLDPQDPQYLEALYHRHDFAIGLFPLASGNFALLNGVVLAGIFTPEDILPAVRALHADLILRREERSREVREKTAAQVSAMRAKAYAQGEGRLRSQETSTKPNPWSNLSLDDLGL